MNPDLGLDPGEPRPLEAKIKSGVAPAITAAAADQRLLEQRTDRLDIGQPGDRDKAR